ncbi:hypothetical protein [Actinomyces qiguomingii]|uniref:hypothetical protein n=1 Tax=Actinomyces qiguomingii TaxID=2057800 RepID=UPI000FFE602C|nr:hypothetical protein [Actinomyces qiguomingii]
MSIAPPPDGPPASAPSRPRLSRRRLGLLAAAVAVAGAIGTAARHRPRTRHEPSAPGTLAQPTPTAPESSTQEHPAGELIIGPASVIGGMTVLRVAASRPGTDLLTHTGAFRGDSTGYTPDGIRLLSLQRGIALRPLSEQPAISDTRPDANFNTTFVAFDGIEGDGEVEVKFPGLGLIGSVPVVASSRAPFRIA